MPSSRRQSLHDSSRPRSLYATECVKEKGVSKSWAGNNGKTPRRTGFLHINTDFSPEKWKPVGFAISDASECTNQQGAPGDAIDAMRAHCTLEPGEDSPQSGGNWIRRNTPPRTQVMLTETRDGSEAMWTSKSPPTTNAPLTNNTPSTASSLLPYFLRSLLGNFDTPEAHDKKRVNSSVNINTASSPASRPPAGMAPIQETPLSSDVQLHPTSPHVFSTQDCPDKEIIAETPRAAGTAPTSPPTNPQTHKPDELCPLMSSDAKSASQYSNDGEKLSPLLPLPNLSVVDLSPTIAHNLETPTSRRSISPAVDGATACDEDSTKIVNEGG